MGPKKSPAPTTPKKNDDGMAEFKKLFLDKLTEISSEVKSLKIIMEENTSEIRSTLSAISKKVEINTDKSKNNEVLILGTINEVDSLKIKLDSAIQTNQVLEERLSVLESSPGTSATINTSEQLDTLVKDIEDVKNRSMRSTLVFKNIEQKGDKTWEETTQLLADELSNIVEDKSTNEININISRAHRTKSTRKGGPLPIVCCFTNWRFADHIKRKIIIASIAGKTKVTVDQMYTPQLTSRRNAALLHRKELIQKDSTLQAFLEYPAKLMGRKRGMGEKYIIIKEF